MGKRLIVCRLKNNIIAILFVMVCYAAAAPAAAAIIIAKDIVVRSYDSVGKQIFLLAAKREQRKTASFKHAFLGIDTHSRANLQYYDGSFQQAEVSFTFKRAEWGGGEIRLYGVSGMLPGARISAKEAHYQLINHRWLFKDIVYHYPDKKIKHLLVEYPLSAQ